MLDLISAYENYLVNVKQASGNTTVSYLRDIRQFAGWLRDTEEAELVDATQQNIADYLHQLSAQGRSCATISRSLASLKNFFAYLVSSGFLRETPVQHVHVERGKEKA